MHDTDRSGWDSTESGRYHMVALTIGCLLVLLGLTALTGWFLEIEIIISIVPGFPSMAFNTALCFVLSGVGLATSMETGKRYRVVSSIACGLAALLSAVRLTEIITLGRTIHNVDVFLTQFVISPAFAEKIGGGMGPNTALIFLISNLSILFALRARGPRGQLVQELTSYIAITLGMIALAGYITDAEQGYRWGPYAAMALHTAVGLVAFGCGLLARSWWMLPTNRAQIPLWIPATICFTGLIVDLYTPLGVANGILYVPLVLTALWFGNRNAPIFFAFVCTVLILLGFFAVNHSQDEYWLGGHQPLDHVSDALAGCHFRFLFHAQ